MVSASGNPYIFGPPIKDPKDFFGRDEEFDALRQCIRKGESVSVVGERRVGKTSLLYYLMNQPDRVWRGSPLPIFVLIDAQLRLRGENDFYSRVIRGCMAAKGASQVGSQLTPSEQVDELALAACLASIAPRRLVLMIDEFETIALDKSFGEQFYLSLRAIAQNYSASIITTTTVPLERCCEEGDVPLVFCNIFQTLRLGPFSNLAFEQFIKQTGQRSGISLEAWRPQILDLAGRFPAYTQLACSCYWEAAAKEPNLGPKDHLEIRQRYADQVEPHFKRIWGEFLSPEERSALIELADGRLGDNSSPVVRQLSQKGYVVDGRVFSSVFAEMFLQREISWGARDTRAGWMGPRSSRVWLDDRGEVWVEGKRVSPPLTKNEYQLLRYLYRNLDRICSRYDIVEAVWSSDYIDQVDDARIAKLVSRLRARIEPDPANPRYLLTVHGRGYRLAP